MAKKKLNSNLYYLEDFRYDKELGHWHNTKLGGYLYAHHYMRNYETKLTPDDLPEWYVYGRYNKRFGYISALGIKQIKFRPFHWDNHLYKDDFIIISYSEEPKITHDNYHSNGFFFIEGFDIFNFLDMVSKYSDFDVMPIINELIEKAKWYEKNHSELVDYNLKNTLDRIDKHIEIIKANRIYFLEHKNKECK